ncbi:ATP-binding protein (plasmid) [Phyllobacterium sp. A18/5-2]|uniref:two-component system sensor histidine kinase NtrB n=1 Tax=Phyllobacterium sp. A18/5-2 TaxID=2978392 RepID=UPI0021C681D3|nr:ATP-binding protein [Phyllobacterium sp. A18/5-2]UXN66113.1 ATP-binding protein [Phyllobacterium sp. A18/5-2]
MPGTPTSPITRSGGGLTQPINTDTQGRSAGEQRARAIQNIIALGEMSQRIAHDFRNILAIIEAGLRLAERDSDDPEKVRTYLSGTREGVGRGLELTSQLLGFTKRQETEVHPENVNDLLQNLHSFLKYGVGPEINIVFDLAPKMPKCLIDPAQFNAAVLNLVVNARDALTDGGTIQVSTETIDMKKEVAVPGRYVCVRVKDTGQGMSEEVSHRVFDPFFTTKGDTGTGLGLPQVHAAMCTIGGDLRVKSVLGAGTTFELLFPIQGDCPRSVTVSGANRPSVDEGDAVKIRKDEPDESA